MFCCTSFSTDHKDKVYHLLLTDVPLQVNILWKRIATIHTGILSALLKQAFWSRIFCNDHMNKVLRGSLILNFQKKSLYIAYKEKFFMSMYIPIVCLYRSTGWKKLCTQTTSIRFFACMWYYVKLQFVSMKKVFEYLLQTCNFSIECLFKWSFKVFFLRKIYSIDHMKKVSHLYVNLCLLVRLLSPRKTLNNNCKKKFFGFCVVFVWKNEHIAGYRNYSLQYIFSYVYSEVSYVRKVLCRHL